MDISKKVVKNILGKKKRGKDSDGDGVFDPHDCQKHNVMRQDAIRDMGPARLRQMQIKQGPMTTEDVAAHPLKRNIKSKIY